MADSPTEVAAHPLEGVGLKAKNFKCFGDEPSGFDEILPINIIIGRNNSGKSSLAEAIGCCIELSKGFEQRTYGRREQPYELFVEECLDEETVRSYARGEQGMQYLRHLVDTKYSRSLGPGGVINTTTDLKIRDPAVSRFFTDSLDKHKWPFKELTLIPIGAERDVLPECMAETKAVEADGKGTTDLIRRYLTSAKHRNGTAEADLLRDLNEVYRGDCKFTRIKTLELQEEEHRNQRRWEIFLSDEHKNDIQLSQSGSSLKSIFVILSVLRLTEERGPSFNWSRVVFAIEEPENNLHPALLRRLPEFLARAREEKGFTLLITTHSPITIDWSSRRSDSQIIHVVQNSNGESTTRTATSYHCNRNILDDLDIRASDILQANGVIWVEGPSDRIYLRRWLDLYSDGRLVEGVHYTTMFYGGALLSHLSGLPPDEVETFISLLKINRNCAVIMDSDREKPGARLKPATRRVRDELCQPAKSMAWITKGREIENYTPIEVYARALDKNAPSVNEYKRLLELPLFGSYSERKVQLARRVAPHIRKQDIESHLDLWKKLGELVKQFDRWNAVQHKNQ